jgi:hypothetical protein
MASFGPRLPRRFKGRMRGAVMLAACGLKRLLEAYDKMALAPDPDERERLGAAEDVTVLKNAWDVLERWKKEVGPPPIVRRPVSVGKLPLTPADTAQAGTPAEPAEGK